MAEPNDAQVSYAILQHPDGGVACAEAVATPDLKTNILCDMC